MSGKGGQWAARFLDDIKERQVNTIIADGITGRSMTHPMRGLVDIANSYERVLKDGGFSDRSNAGKEICDKGEKGEWVGMKGNAEAFKALAKWGADALGQSPAKSPKRIIYQRITSTSTQLSTISERIGTKYGENYLSRGLGKEAVLPKMDDLDPEDRAVIAKAWELGDSTVVMQTTIGIDGDLVTRITRNYAGESGAAIRELHEDSVRTAMSTWESLVKGILMLASAAIGKS